MSNDKIGALWEKDGWMSGEVEIEGVKTKVVVFKNTYKKEDRQPDWNILKARPKDAPKEETSTDPF